jgi:hypothetical protein
MAIKLDFKKTLKSLYDPKEKGIHVVDVPPMNFLMVDGMGDPNFSIDYQQAIEALYSLSYGIKFDLKSAEFDYSIPPLEGLWWMDDMREFSVANKHRWKWTMMIMQPEQVTAETLAKAMQKRSKKGINPALAKVRFETYTEGEAVQTVYTGPYAEEAATIAAMHRYIDDHGYRTNGKHHEIYLSDARKTPAEKRRTILRQPVFKVFNA